MFVYKNLKQNLQLVTESPNPSKIDKKFTEKELVNTYLQNCKQLCNAIRMVWLLLTITLAGVRQDIANMTFTNITKTSTCCLTAEAVGITT